jgi:hypothetical protein
MGIESFEEEETLFPEEFRKSHSGEKSVVAETLGLDNRCR